MKKNTVISYVIVELGAATTLTMGTALKEWEGSWRPRGQ